MMIIEGFSLNAMSLLLWIIFDELEWKIPTLIASALPLVFALSQFVHWMPFSNPLHFIHFLVLLIADTLPILFSFFSKRINGWFWVAAAFTMYLMFFALNLSHVYCLFYCIFFSKHTFLGQSLIACSANNTNTFSTSSTRYTYLDEYKKNMKK